MSEPPRLSNLGEILDRTAQLYRSRFLVFFGIGVIPTGIVLVFALGIFLIAIWAGSTGTTSPSLTGTQVVAVAFLAVLALLALPIFLAVTSLATAALNHAAALAYKGQTSTIRGSYKFAWLKGWRYIGLYILQALVIWGAPLVVWSMLLVVSAGAAALAQTAGMGVSAGVVAGVAAALAVVCLLSYCVYMLLRLSLAFPACVVEQIDALAALGRSSKLSKGSRGRIFLLNLLGVVLSWLLSIAVLVPFAIVLALFPGANDPQHAQTAGLVLAFSMYGTAFAVQAFTRPVYAIALMLFYYDQRIRQEGYDIEWMMEQAGLVAAPSHAGNPA